jgi:hypothetical protein
MKNADSVSSSNTRPGRGLLLGGGAIRDDVMPLETGWRIYTSSSSPHPDYVWEPDTVIYIKHVDVSAEP